MNGADIAVDGDADEYNMVIKNYAADEVLSINFITMLLWYGIAITE